MIEISRTATSVSDELSRAVCEQTLLLQTMADRVKRLESGTLDREKREATYAAVVNDVAAASRKQAVIQLLASELDGAAKFGPQGQD